MKAARKEKLPIESLAESLVISVHEATKMFFQDKKQLEHCRVVVDRPDAFLELYFFHLFPMLQAVSDCSLPRRVKASIVKHMKRGTGLWLQHQVGVKEQELPPIMALLDLRLTEYETALGKALQGKDCTAAEILIKNLRGVLSEEVSPDDIGTWFSLYSLFMNSVIGYADLMKDITNKHQILAS